MQKQHLTSNRSQPKKSKLSKKALLTLSFIITALLGLGFVNLLPKFSNPIATTKKNPTLSGATVTLENSEEKSETNQGQNSEENSPQNNEEYSGQITAHWGSPTSQAQFWFDGSLTAASCDQYNCTVPKPKGANQVYLRWFNISENQWYYFQVNADYKGRFEGIPLRS